jgi:hypothetical protein
MTNVIEPSFITKLDIPTERILRKAQDANLGTVVVVGWDEGGEFYFASSVADGGETLWLLEMAKKKLLEAGE